MHVQLVGPRMHVALPREGGGARLLGELLLRQSLGLAGLLQRDPQILRDGLVLQLVCLRVELSCTHSARGHRAAGELLAIGGDLLARRLRRLLGAERYRGEVLACHF